MVGSHQLILQATNVHSGGGRELLAALLKGWPDELAGVLQVDQRMVIEGYLSDRLKIRTVAPTLVQRLKAEWWLRKNVVRTDLVLCFGNLPPLFRLRGPVVLFLQNRYLIDRVSLDGFSFLKRWSLELERRWVAWRIGNVQTVVVQTPSMRRLLVTSGVLKSQSVLVCPFLSTGEGYSRVGEKFQVNNACKRFVYVASGEPHKNHRRLVEAWCRLSDEGLFPILKLTLNTQAFVELSAWIEQKKRQHRLQIENIGHLTHTEVLNLYSNSDALIYPSLFESLGIPLIEARTAKLAILASELDYVRDVIDPEYSFDPLSAVSIARSVKRFIGVSESPLPLLDAREFLLKVLNTFK